MIPRRPPAEPRGTTLAELTQSPEVYVLCFGRMPEKAHPSDHMPGSCNAFRLLSSSRAAKARVRAAWAQHGPAILKAWTLERRPGEPWAVTILREGADA